MDSQFPRNFLAHLPPLVVTDTLTPESMVRSLGTASLGEISGTVQLVWHVAESWQATAKEHHKHKSACHGGPVTAFCHQTHLFLEAFRCAALTVLEHCPQSARRAQQCPVLVSIVENTLLPCDLCDVALSCSTGRECGRRVGCCS